MAVQNVSLEAQLIGGDGGRIRALHIDQLGSGFQARQHTGYHGFGMASLFADQINKQIGVAGGE